MLTAWAQGGEYSNTVEQSYQNVKLHVKLTVSEAYGSDNKISGTKCDIATEVKAFNLGIPGSVIAVRNTHSALTVGGQLFYDLDMPGDPGGGSERPSRGGAALPSLAPPPESEVFACEDAELAMDDPLPELPNVHNAYPARFASTHFDDGANVPITLSVNFVCWVEIWPGYNIPVGPFLLIAQVNPVVYNKQLRWMTTLDGNGNPLVPAALAEFQLTAEKLKLHADHALHSQVYPGNVLLNKVQVLAGTTMTTAMGAVCHGYENSSGQFEGLVSGGSYNQTIVWAEFAAAKNVAFPLRNWLIFYACGLLSRGPALLTDFNVLSPLSGAVAGFPTSEFIAVYANGGGPLLFSIHFQEVASKLEEGFPLGVALSEANSLQSYLGHSYAMGLVGDPLTTTTHVYASGADRQSMGISMWDKFAYWWMAWLPTGISKGN